MRASREVHEMKALCRGYICPYFAPPILVKESLFFLVLVICIQRCWLGDYEHGAQNKLDRFRKKTVNHKLYIGNTKGVD
jgi:hypothetical protein